MLSERRDDLEKAGVLYPDVTLAGSKVGLCEHNAFAESLSGIRRYPHMKAEQWAESFLTQMREKNCHTLLLSAESFFGTPQAWAIPQNEDFFTLHRKKIEHLAALIPAKQVQIIAYLRRQDLWLESAIGHIIRYEGLLDRSVYKDDAQITELLAPHLDYLRHISMWKDVFNSAIFTIVPYEHDVLAGGDTALDFLERTGLNDILHLSENIPQKLENRSWSIECLTVKKVLNKQQKPKYRERTIIKILDKLDNRKDLPRTRFTIPLETKNEILERYKGDNRLLAERYSGPIGSFFSYPDPEKSIKFTPAVAEAVFQILRAFEHEYYRPSRRILETAANLKGLIRNKYPALYTRIKVMIRKNLGKTA